MRGLRAASRLLLRRSRCLPPQPRLLSSAAGPVVSCDLEDITIPSLSWSELCWSNLAQFSRNPALVDGVTGRSYTLGEAREMSGRAGSGLLRAGAEPGQVVAALLPNIPEYPVLFMAASEAGLVLTTLNPLYTPGEIRGQLVNSEAKMIVTIPPLMEKVKEATAGTEIKIIVIGDSGDSQLSFRQLVTDPGDLVSGVSVSPDDIAVLPYSSGTTGVPKGVKLTHRNLVANMAQLDHPVMEFMTTEEITVCVLPMFHIFAMNVTMSNMLWRGGKLVTLPMFEPSMFLTALMKYRPTYLHLAPPLVQFLANHPAVTEEHLASLHTIFVGAAPVGQALINLFHQKAPRVRFREGFGMTEGGPAITFTRGNLKDTMGSSGQLLPNMRMKVVSLETGEPLSAGEEGELCFSGPNFMPGYFKNEAATAETIFGDWLHTGDIGYYDQNGHVFYVDRKKELIKVKGFQVAPAELEDLLRRLSGVKDVAVIGVPDERAGEVPRAYVVRAAESLSEEEVKNHVAANLSVYKHLAGGVEFLPEIPKSAAGKILRKNLKASFLEKQ